MTNSKNIVSKSTPFIDEVCIVIPVYKENLSYSELISLTQCGEVLKNYKKFLVAPSDLKVDEYLKIVNDLNILRFEKIFFKGFNGYNRLLLSSEFYKSFINFKYILIHQLDVFIFKDELSNWCSKNYEYIGAPWFTNNFKYFIKIARKVSPYSAIRLLINKNIKNKVGNGGLSLRNVNSCLESLELQRNLIKKWRFTNEDLFWSFFAQSKRGKFKIPDFKTALNFAIEQNPVTALEINNFELPFGIHAWEKWGKEFWKPYIEQFGYLFDSKKNYHF